MKKKTKLGQLTIKGLREATVWTKGYRYGREHAAELAEAVLTAHGASKVIRQRMRKALTPKPEVK